MFTQLTKYFFFPAFIFHVFIMNAFGQSPSSPILLHSPFETTVTIAAGVQRGWGSGSISDLNQTGIYGVVDFTRYKFQMALGITGNENFKNSFSFSSGIAISFLKSPSNYILQPALFSGFGYTKVYTSTTVNYDMINVPLGISIGIDGPVPFGDLNISVAPKVQYRHLKLNDGENVFGLGVNIGILFTPTGKRLGVKIGFDFLNIKREPLVENKLERSFIVGVEYLLN